MLSSPLLIVLSLLAALFLLSVVESAQADETCAGFACRDFVQYWSASQVAKQGGDPYSAPALLKLQESIGYPDPTPTMMWNPPWLLVLMRAFLWSDFSTSAYLWLAANIFFLIAGSILSLQAAKTLGLTTGVAWHSPLMLVSMLWFYPALDNIRSGQLGLLLAFAFAAACYFIAHKRDTAGGACLAVLTVKPHLFYLIWIFLGFFVVRARRVGIALGLLLAFLLLVGTTHFVFPGALSQWFFALKNPQPGVVQILEWRSETLVGWVRGVLFDASGNRFDSLIWLVPAALSLTAIVLFYVQRTDLRQIYPVMALSVATAGYGWFSDFSLLLPLQVILTQRSAESTSQMGRLTLFALIGCQVVLFALTALGTGIHHYVFLLAFVLLYLWRLHFARHVRD